MTDDPKFCRCGCNASTFCTCATYCAHDLFAIVAEDVTSKMARIVATADRETTAYALGDQLAEQGECPADFSVLPIDEARAMVAEVAR